MPGIDLEVAGEGFRVGKFIGSGNGQLAFGVCSRERVWGVVCEPGERAVLVKELEMERRGGLPVNFGWWGSHLGLCGCDSWYLAGRLLEYILVRVRSIRIFGRQRRDGER